MSSNRFIRIAALVGVCLGGTAFAGLPWADASSTATAHKSSQPATRCVTYDADDGAPKCLRSGPRGPRGKQGLRGAIGPIGAVGPLGLTGAVGAVGRQGPTGQQGIQGDHGVQGAPGAFASGGSNPGGHTVVVLGSKIGPIPIPTGPGTGTELTPSVARCPVGDPRYGEAYDGGVTITTADPNHPGQPTNDIVGIEGSFPGRYAGPTQVDPLPTGSPPGAVSAQAANAYEAQAVITQMNSGDNVTVQSYVVCGPTG